MEPPRGISAAARLATSVKEKQEITMVRMKFSRVGVGVAALELVLVGKGDGVDEEVDAAPVLLERREDGVDRGDVLDIAGQQKIASGRLRPAA